MGHLAGNEEMERWWIWSGAVARILATNPRERGPVSCPA
jgi:hypothetical protein